MLNLHCYNPEFRILFPGDGIFAGRQGQATTPIIQFNIKTPSTGSNVLYVSSDPRNDAFCEIEVPPGHRVVNGWFTPDRANSYTRHQNDENREDFARDEILNWVAVLPSYTTHTITFRVHALASNVKGTMNGTFTVVYEIGT